MIIAIIDKKNIINPIITPIAPYVFFCRLICLFINTIAATTAEDRSTRIENMMQKVLKPLFLILFYEDTFFLLIL